MNDTPRPLRRHLPWLLLPVLLLVGYPLVTAGVRLYVDQRIEKSHGMPLPAFALRDRSGALRRSADLQGKLAVLHFTRSYCHSCEAEKAEVKRFVKELDPTTVTFWSVTMDRVMGFSEEATQRTLAGSGFVHPVLEADKAFVDAFHGSGWAKVTPITYFISADGKIVWSLRGAQTLDTLRGALSKLKAGD